MDQIEKAAPQTLVDKLKAADNFYKNEYAPVASSGAFPRTVRDMAPEDIANTIVKTRGKAQLQAWDSMSGVLSDATKKQLAGNVFQKVLDGASPDGIFDPKKAVTLFRNIDPELRRRMLGNNTDVVQGALNSLSLAAKNIKQATNMNSALSDALATAEKQYKDVLAGASLSQKMGAPRPMGGNTSPFAISHLVRGGVYMSNPATLPWGVVQTTIGTSMLFPGLFAKTLFSPTSRQFVRLLTTVGSPTTQGYATAVSKLSDLLLKEGLRQVPTAPNNSGPPPPP
jgi:hypothetical protein